MEKQTNVLTVMETCERLKCCRSSLYTLMKEGKLTGFTYKEKGRRYFTEKEVESFIESSSDEKEGL